MRAVELDRHLMRDLYNWVCVCVEKKQKENVWEWMRVCAVDVAVCEHVRARREFTRWQLISCLTFPVSQGSSRKNNAEKPPTADNRNATKRQRKRLLAGDWIIAVVWDRRQGKYANDCTMFGADAQHLPDPSTHPSPSALHNSRNTLKKEKNPEWLRKERGCEINIVFAFSLPLLSNCFHFKLTVEHWKYFELLLPAIFWLWGQSRAV